MLLGFDDLLPLLDLLLLPLDALFPLFRLPPEEASLVLLLDPPLLPDLVDPLALLEDPLEPLDLEFWLWLDRLLALSSSSSEGESDDELSSCSFLCPDPECDDREPVLFDFEALELQSSSRGGGGGGGTCLVNVVGKGDLFLEGIEAEPDPDLLEGLLTSVIGVFGLALDDDDFVAVSSSLELELLLLDPLRADVIDSAGGRDLICSYVGSVDFRTPDSDEVLSSRFDPFVGDGCVFRKPANPTATALCLVGT